MRRVYSDLLEKKLEGSRLELLRLLADQAVALKMPIYIVGGAVRDLLLGRPVREFDLVLEGDAIAFAKQVAAKYGGNVLAHSKFWTATWEIDESVLKRLKIPVSSDFSSSFDLTSARSEIYASPGALPKVTRSSIDDDLRRRDFTINAMAVRLDGDLAGQLLDVLGGQADLERGVIRVLHPRSFIDDPTRIFRAVRYAVRCGFSIDGGTSRLIDQEAMHVLAGLSGERLRHEFDMIFEEERPTDILHKLKDLRVLASVHPVLSSNDIQGVAVLSQSVDAAIGKMTLPDILSFRQALGWVLLLMNAEESEIKQVGERLAFPALLTKSASAASRLRYELMSKNESKPSQWTFYLDDVPALAVHAVSLVESAPILREYLTKWKNINPFTTGDDLVKLGLAPGPRFGEILSLLRAAWLDGQVSTKKEEMNLLNTFLKNK